MRIVFWLLVFILFLGLIFGWYLLACEDDWCFIYEWQKVRATNSFDECIARGYPASGAFPRECRAGSKVFVETIEIAEKPNLIRVKMPRPGEIVASPLTVEGEARGSWYFEASFPVKIIDSRGRELGVMPALAQGEWMTENYVPFKALLFFDDPEIETGTLILEKDNPSGLPEHADELRVPLRFQPKSMAGDTIELTVYFPSSELNPEALDCSKVFPVVRRVSKTETVARAALEMLFKGPTGTEVRQGYFTSINPGVRIQSLKIENGTLKADFSEELEFQVGGSCRVASIRAQIQKTLKQFPTVKDVEISIDGRIEDILQP